MSAHQTAIWNHFQTGDSAIFDRNRPRLDALLRSIRKEVAKQPGALVVNVGPGNGYLESRCVEAGINVLSIDPDEATVMLMRDRGVTAETAFLNDLPLADASVACLVASEVLEHVPTSDLLASVREIRRILKPGGIFLGTVPFAERLADNIVFCPHCREQFHRWGHQQSFTPATLRPLLSEVGVPELVRVQSFVDWSRRSASGQLKNAFRYALGRFGLSLASPNILFRVRR